MPKEKILIVEDERVVAMDIQNRLKDLGYSVCGLASSGEEAVKKASEIQPDLILMDIVLKGRMDGIDAARQIRERFNIPVVYLTTFSDEKTLQKARLTEPYGYILKPFDDRELRSNIEMALYKGAMEARTEHLNRVIRAIRNVNQLIVREKNPERLIQGACDNLIETRGFFYAWIALLDENEKLTATAEAGLGEDFLTMAERLKRGELPECAKRALANPDVVVIKDPSSICLDCPLTWNYYNRGAMSIRMEYGEKVYGLLTVSTPIDFITTKEEQSLFQEIAGDISFALHTIGVEEERKQAEEALKKSEEKLKVIFDESPNVMMIMDYENGEILNVNQAARHILGYEKKTLLGKHFSILFPSESELTRNNLLEKLSIHGSVFESQKFVRADGSGLPTDLSATLIPWDKGKAILATFRDVSEQIRLENQFFQAQKMEAIGVLVEGVAHDFNNLLTTIIGSSDLMIMSIGKDHNLRKNLEDIRKAGKRAASLTRQLLLFSRRQILEPKVINLNDVILDMDKMLRRLIGENIDLETVLAPDLGRVEADPGQIEQIIMNLAVNAKDAMPRGGKLTINTANVELDEAYVHSHADVTPGPYVMMAISDTGTGMDEETLSKVFDPFFTTKEAGKGTGLGLSTIYGIVKQSGGNIWVYSEPGKGATFKIYLPRVEKKTGGTEAVEAAAESLTGSETILVVEDNEMVRDLAQTIFQHYGYRVLTAQDGEEAIRVSQEHDGPIDLMLTDVVMPGMSGNEVVKRLNTLRPEMKVLYMSGYTNNVIVHHGDMDRETAFIQKPFTMESLVCKVKEVISKIEY